MKLAAYKCTAGTKRAIVMLPNQEGDVSWRLACEASYFEDLTGLQCCTVQRIKPQLANIQEVPR